LRQKISLFTEPEAVLVLLEIFFPFIGIIAIVILAMKTEGMHRWFVLILGPAILLIFHVFLLEMDWISGNLLTVAIFGIMIMGTWYYYIVLLIIGVIKGWKYWWQRR